MRFVSIIRATKGLFMTRKIQILRGTNAQNNSFTGSIGELTMDTTKKEVRIHDGTTAGGKTVSAPTGLIASFGGSTAPDGWLVCDGSAVSRTDYADLFAVIGTTYGSGDGNSTFNLPDISDCFVQGGTPGTTHSAGLPNITGSYTSDFIIALKNNSQCIGAISSIVGNGGNYGNRGADSSWGYGFNFDASSSNSIYGNSTTVQPKSVELLYCIKY